MATRNQNFEPMAPPVNPRHIGFNALCGAGEANNESGEAIVVPRGWTTLIHGTDTGRWQLGDPVKLIKRGGLSAITSEDKARDQALRERLMAEGIGSARAYGTTGSYARPRTDGAEPVEVRVLFYRSDLSPRRGPAPEVSDIKAGLDPETLKLVGQYHQDRHPVVPWNESLIRLGGGTDETSNRHIEYFVPKSVATDYLEAVARHQVETIPENI